MADWILFTVLIVVVLAIGAGVLFVRYRDTTDRKLKSLFAAIGVEHLRNIVIPDGTGGEIQIDCLIRTSHGLIALDINDTDGTVFAGDRLDTWSATHNGQRITFDNPISQLQRRLEAINLLAKGVPLEGRILFTGNVDFPKGHPPLVATVDSLIAEYEQATRNASSARLEHHWEGILGAIVD